MTSDNPNIEAAVSPLILTPADFADTGQWRLVIYVSTSGMGAVLRHASDLSRPAVRLFDDRWPRCEGRALLERIENCVYEHPAILDDYATEIVVETQRITWVPTEVLDSGDFPEERIFEALFPGEEVMTDRGDTVSALFSLADGFDSFMARTIPGSRMRCHLAVLEAGLRKRIGYMAGLRIYILRGTDKVTLFLYDGDRLVAATEHPMVSDEDVVRRLEELRQEWHFETVTDLAEILPGEWLGRELPIAVSAVVYRELLEREEIE